VIQRKPESHAIKSPALNLLNCKKLTFAKKKVYVKKFWQDRNKTYCTASGRSACVFIRFTVWSAERFYPHGIHHKINTSDISKPPSFL